MGGLGFYNGSGLYEVGVFKAQMFVKALLLIRITKVGIKHFRPNFIKPLLSASAVSRQEVSNFKQLKNNKMSKYKEIEFGFGNIESAIKELKSHNELVCGLFNGQMLYSDIDDLDSAYKKITGKTKSECDEAERVRHEEYQEQQRKHKEAIPELTKQWIEKGTQILDKKYRETWAKCVPIRLSDLYQGMELQMCLDIVLELNNGCTLDKAKEIIESQGHSGMSFGLVCSMVKSFCNRGQEFVNYARS